MPPRVSINLDFYSKYSNLTFISVNTCAAAMDNTITFTLFVLWLKTKTVKLQLFLQVKNTSLSIENSV